MHVLSASTEFSVPVTDLEVCLCSSQLLLWNEVYIVFLLCVCCHLPIHTSLNQLRYLSGFTRSLKVRTENWGPGNAIKASPILTTRPLGNPKCGGSVCNCCLNHEHGLGWQSQVCNPRVPQAAVGCVPGSSSSPPLPSPALLHGLAPLPATYSCSPPPLGSGIAVNEPKMQLDHKKYFCFFQYCF